ncbi:MAG TPA: hypothetical protein VEC13_01015 [Candidatus Paceibacterota bacterium]|nr:hypothetical protein [Candidatus Paceibacterota bacterium]
MRSETLINLLNLVEEPNRIKCVALWRDYKERIDIAPGSSDKHQAWPGGYIHHLEETMNFAVELYDIMSKHRKLDFNISDVILVLFLHDLEKPFVLVEPKLRFETEEDKINFVISKAREYGIELSELHENALRFIHGEGKHYSKTERIQKPLAAFVHICDTVSARIWFDYPKVSNKE